MNTKTYDYETIRNELIENKEYMIRRGIFTDDEISNALSVMLAYFCEYLTVKEVGALYMEIVAN